MIYAWMYLFGLPVAVLIAIASAVHESKLPHDERIEGGGLAYAVAVFAWPVFVAVLVLGCLMLACDAIRGPRSGLTKTGLVAQLGTIDSDYRGEIGVIVANLGGLHESGKPRTICRGDRIAQLVFARVEHPTLVQAGRLSETERGSGGFGSTGR